MTPALPLRFTDGSGDFMARSGKTKPTATSQTDASPPAVAEVAKTVTMKDIAKVAGVTSMTVSRVMKGDDHVAPATRELVLGIARDLNYTTNPAGRALRTGRTNTIAVVAGSLNQPYHAAMVSSLESLLHASGYQTRLVLNQNDLRHLIRSTQAAVADGVIITGMHNLLSRFHDAGHQITQPFVHISIVKLENQDCVQCDLIPAFREALQWMLHAGRRRIAYVGIGDLASQSELRSQAYAEGMKAAGRTPEWISAGESYAVPGAQRVEILRRYFTERGCPDALLCLNDEVAMQTYRALMDIGVRIPDDVLLVGCDGLPSTAYFEPPLSTIAQPFDELAATAWKFLQARIAEPNLASQYACFNAELVMRRSLQP